MVWNPQSCIKDLQSKDPVRHMISPQVILLFLRRHCLLVCLLLKLVASHCLCLK